MNVLLYDHQLGYITEIALPIMLCKEVTAQDFKDDWEELDATKIDIDTGSPMLSQILVPRVYYPCYDLFTPEYEIVSRVQYN
jgi:hypothetical protein